MAAFRQRIPVMNGVDSPCQFQSLRTHERAEPGAPWKLAEMNQAGERLDQASHNSADRATTDGDAADSAQKIGVSERGFKEHLEGPWLGFLPINSEALTRFKRLMGLKTTPSFSLKRTLCRDRRKLKEEPGPIWISGRGWLTRTSMHLFDIVLKIPPIRSDRRLVAVSPRPVFDRKQFSEEFL
ncbi:conserved hypothetical protein [Histoplasma capsulatum var. duboisii H88]|uniref:Uncharacterized protein n=1 Tax=Ajellomyces capsulatus (strain H88) TaxID=544711 RepID=F0ULA3_AJEC8|nr:conserved hypothetical protein [Histoplasma capsulatum var. duboisii H88]